MRLKSKGKFIQEAIRKPGALHKQLGIPLDVPIRPDYLEYIAEKPIGTKLFITHYWVGPHHLLGHMVTITPLLKRRVVLARTLRGFQKE